MVALGRTVAAGIAAIALVAFAATLLGQGRDDVQDPASLAALTAEVHQLRLAVEESTRSQSQTQALSVYLSAQQARLVQAGARADSARKELDALADRSSEIADRVAGITDVLNRITDPDQRNALEQEVRMLKQQQKRLASQEEQARAREMELSQTLDTENARWADLISRLEQLVKR